MSAINRVISVWLPALSPRSEATAWALSLCFSAERVVFHLAQHRVHAGLGLLQRDDHFRVTRAGLSRNWRRLVSRSDSVSICSISPPIP